MRFYQEMTFDGHHFAHVVAWLETTRLARKQDEARRVVRLLERKA